MTMNKYNKIGMSLDCYNDYRIVRANFTGFQNYGRWLSFVVTLTALGDDFIKVEVQDNHYENKPNVMPYYHQVEKSHGYVFVDMYIMRGLLIGDKTYHYDGISLNSSSKISPLLSSDNDSCPMVLSISDNNRNNYNDYQNRCKNVTRNVESTKIWENINWDNFTIYTNAFCNDLFMYKFKTVNNQIEFLIGIHGNDYNHLDLKFEGITIYLDVFHDDDGAFKINMAGDFQETIKLTKKFGYWRGYDILPVLITQDYIVFGREKRILFYRYAKIRQLPEIALGNPLYRPLSIVFMPKEYETPDNCEIFPPKNHYSYVFNYHYLSPKLCKNESTYTVGTEGYLYFLFGIEKKCFKNDTIVSGTIFNETFSIFHNRDKIVFILDGRETDISLKDIQKRYGYIFIGITLYPKYFYVGSTLALYAVNDSEYFKDLSFVDLTVDDNSCDFMFVLPKNESDLYNIDECDIPDKWKMKSAEMPKEEMWFLVACFSCLFVSIIIYATCTCYSIGCCRKSTKFKQI